MSSRKTKERPAALFTVRKTVGNDQLVVDETTGWRWSRVAKTEMSRADADTWAARLGGVVCRDGKPVDKPHAQPPQKPKLPAGKAPGEPDDPATKIRKHIEAGQDRDALRLAKKMRLGGDDKTAVARAWEALQRPAFCRSLGQDPDALLRKGMAVVRRRFGGGS